MKWKKCNEELPPLDSRVWFKVLLSNGYAIGQFVGVYGFLKRPCFRNALGYIVAQSTKTQWISIEDFILYKQANPDLELNF